MKQPAITVDSSLQAELAKCKTSEPYPMSIIATMAKDGSFNFALDTEEENEPEEPDETEAPMAKSAKKLPKPVQQYMATM
jgi:hypothetical protein